MARSTDLDYVLTNAIYRAVEETLRVTGRKITIDQAVDILDSQARGIKEAMENKDIAKIDSLGKFLIKPGREELLHASKEAAKNKLDPEQRKALFKAIGEQIRAKKNGSI